MELVLVVNLRMVVNEKVIVLFDVVLVVGLMLEKMCVGRKTRRDGANDDTSDDCGDGWWANSGGLVVVVSSE